MIPPVDIPGVRSAGSGPAALRRPSPPEGSPPSSSGPDDAAPDGFGPALRLSGAVGGGTAASLLSDAEARRLSEALAQGADTAARLHAAVKAGEAAADQMHLAWIEAALDAMVRVLPLAERTPGGATSLARQADAMLKAAPPSPEGSRDPDQAMRLGARIGTLEQAARREAEAADRDGDQTRARDARAAADALRDHRLTLGTPSSESLTV